MKNKHTPRYKAAQPQQARITAPAATLANPSKPRTTLLRSRWMLALVAVFSFLLYSNTLKHDYANDDLASVSENKVIQQGWGQLGDVLTKANWYGYGQQNHSILRPFTGFTLATEVELFGPGKPRPHHFMNVLLYAISCTVLFTVLRKMLNGWHPLLPLAVTLLFAAHPIHTEVVANIKSRDELLAFLFGLALPLYFLLKYIDKEKALFLGLAVMSYFLGVFSKESAVTFLAVFPLTLFFFTGLPLRKIAFVSALFIIPVALYLMARASWLDPAPDNNRLVIDNVVFGAADTVSRLATIAVIMLEYLRLLLFPHPLSWDYSYNQIPIASLANPKALLSIAVHLGLLALAVLGLRKKKMWSYCIWFYFITMSVYSNLLVPIHATLGERFLFTPSLAFCLLLAYGAFQLLPKRGAATEPASGSLFNYSMVLVALIATFYSFKTIARNKDWKDSLSISKAGAEVATNSARAHSAYGSALMKQGEQATNNPAVSTPFYQQALAETKRAVEIYPNEANYLYNVGVLSYYLNDTATARQMFHRSVALDSTKLNAQFNLGATYEKEGNYNMALKIFRKVQAVDSAFQNVTFQIGNVAAKAKQHELAIANLHAHLRKFPAHADGYNSLGVVHYEKQQFDQALQAFNRAIQLAPTRHDFYANAASVYYMRQQYAEAARNYEQALKYNPGNPNYTSFLNTARQMAGTTK